MRLQLQAREHFLKFCGMLLNKLLQRAAVIGAGAIFTRNSPALCKQNLVLFCLDIDKDIKRIKSYT
jgi:hypothetical protein